MCPSSAEVRSGGGPPSPSLGVGQVCGRAVPDRGRHSRDVPAVPVAEASAHRVPSPAFAGAGSCPSSETAGVPSEDQVQLSKSGHEVAEVSNLVNVDSILPRQLGPSFPTIGERSSGHPGRETKFDFQWRVRQLPHGCAVNGFPEAQASRRGPLSSPQPKRRAVRGEKRTDSPPKEELDSIREPVQVL